MNKLLTFFIVCLSAFSTVSFAQNTVHSSSLLNKGMVSNDMQGMMAQMQVIQQCMANVDQQHLMNIGNEAQALHKNIQALCSKGDVKGAEKAAMAFSKKLMADGEVKKVRECVKDLPDMMKGHIPFTNIEDMQKQYEDADICSVQM